MTVYVDAETIKCMSAQAIVFKRTKVLTVLQMIIFSFSAEEYSPSKHTWNLGSFIEVKHNRENGAQNEKPKKELKMSKKQCQKNND